MLTRYRWYRIKLPCKVSDLLDLFINRPLKQEYGFGFSYIEHATDADKIRFLWRTKIVVTRLDDDGNPNYEEVDTINFTDFSIISMDEKLFLRVENPGRNIRDLLNSLEYLVGMGFSCKAVTFEKSMPDTIFNNIEVANLVGLKIVDAVIDKDLMSSMTFSSKQGMVMGNIAILDGLKYKTDTSTYEVIHEGIRGQITLTSSGSVRISGQLAPKLVSLVELDLPRLG